MDVRKGKLQPTDSDGSLEGSDSSGRMGIRRAVILFADIIGASEVSNNRSLTLYNEYLTEFQNAAATTRGLVFGGSELDNDTCEMSVRGDEVCLILHGGPDRKEQEAEDYGANRAKYANDARNALHFALYLQLLWMVSPDNRTRVSSCQLPRLLALGASDGLVIRAPRPFSPSKDDYLSEGYAINLAKRVESASRGGQHFQFYASETVASMALSRIPGIAWTDQLITLEAKGIVPCPRVRELETINSPDFLLSNEFSRLLQEVDTPSREAFVDLADGHTWHRWLQLLKCLLKETPPPKPRAHPLPSGKEASPSESEIVRRRGAAGMYFEFGAWDRAIEELRTLTRLVPRDSQAWNNLGRAYRRVNDLAEAITAYQKAIEIRPKYAAAWTNLGSAYYWKGEFEQAVAAHRKAIEIKPDYAAAWYNLGLALRQTRDIDGAIKAYSKAVEIRPGYPIAWNNLGVAYRDNADPERAINAFNQALEIDNDMAIALYNLARTYAMNGAFDDALRHLERAISLDGQFRGMTARHADFNAVRDDPRFKKLIGDEGKEEEAGTPAAE